MGKEIGVYQGDQGIRPSLLQEKEKLINQYKTAQFATLFFAGALMLGSIALACAISAPVMLISLPLLAVLAAVIWGIYDERINNEQKILSKLKILL